MTAAAVAEIGPLSSLTIAVGEGPSSTSDVSWILLHARKREEMTPLRQVHEAHASATPEVP